MIHVNNESYIYSSFSTWLLNLLLSICWAPFIISEVISDLPSVLRTFRGVVNVLIKARFMANHL